MARQGEGLEILTRIARAVYEKGETAAMVDDTVFATGDELGNVKGHGTIIRMDTRLQDITHLTMPLSQWSALLEARRHYPGKTVLALQLSDALLVQVDGVSAMETSGRFLIRDDNAVVSWPVQVQKFGKSSHAELKITQAKYFVTPFKTV